MTSDIMTLQEVAAYLKVNKKTVYRMLESNQIPAFRVRSEWRFKRELIDQWIEAQANRPARSGESQGASERGRPGQFQIPVLGRIAAGTPILADENREGTVTVDRDLAPNPEGLFALRVQGESMIKAGINDGDIALIRAQPDVDDGQIAAVIIGQEATLKRVYKRGRRLVLKPENDALKDITVRPQDGDVRIAGRFLQVMQQKRPEPTTPLLTKEEIFRQLKAHQDILDKYKVRRIGLFGSYARGEQTPKSDIDLVVEFEEPDFDNFMNLNYFLEDLFGKKVEILTPAGVESIRIQSVKDKIRGSIIYA